MIYWNKCGAKNGFKQVKVIDGKKSFIKTSNKLHLVTKGGEYTNVKKL